MALVAGSGLVSCKCSQEQTDVASDNFKDCMDEKKAALLQIDTGVGDKKQHICDSLGDLATVCGSAVDSLAGCKGREYVDNLVAIHINSMSGNIFSIFQHPCYIAIIILLISPIIPKCFGSICIRHATCQHDGCLSLAATTK